MRIIKQDFDQIIDSLSPLEAGWMDDTAEAIMARICSVPMKSEYDRSDIAALIDAEDGTAFQVSKFCVGLFLGFSKDKLEVELADRLGAGGTGIKRYHSDRDTYLDVLEALGLRDAMTARSQPHPCRNGADPKGERSHLYPGAPAPVRQITPGASLHAHRYQPDHRTARRPVAPPWW